MTIRILGRLAALALLGLLAGCGHRSLGAEECMARAMYFESNRSSAEGMLAVGTVVMNRVNSGRYPKSVCGVVGQNKQFAPGVLTKEMGKGRDLAQKTARVVLRGARHPEVGRAMFFHTAGYSYGYGNMHYVAIAGGNAFYERRKDATATQASVAARQASRAQGSAPSRDHRPVSRFEPRPASAAGGSVQPLPRAAAVPMRPAPVAPTRSAPPSAEAGGLAPMSIDDLIRSGGLPTG